MGDELEQEVRSAKEENVRKEEESNGFGSRYEDGSNRLSMTDIVISSRIKGQVSGSRTARARIANEITSLNPVICPRLGGLGRIFAEGRVGRGGMIEVGLSTSLGEIRLLGL